MHRLFSIKMGDTINIGILIAINSNWRGICVLVDRVRVVAEAVAVKPVIVNADVPAISPAIVENRVPAHVGQAENKPTAAPAAPPKRDGRGETVAGFSSFPLLSTLLINSRLLLSLLSFLT